MFELNLGDGYVIVPRIACTANRLYLPSLNIIEQNDIKRFCLLMPNGRIAEDENCERPFVYDSLQACIDDAQVLKRRV